MDSTDTGKIQALREENDAAAPKPLDGFACRRCGRCCRWPGYVRLNEEEIDQIAQFLAMTPEAFIEQYTRLADDRSGLVILNREDGHCIFYQHPPGCRIQAVKPEQCRGFPRQWNFPRWHEVCLWGVENIPVPKTEDESP